VPGTQNKSRKFIPNSTSSYKRKLYGIYPECRWVTPKELRKYKGVWVVRDNNGDLAVAASLLQNTEDVVRRSYSEGDDATASKEFTELFEEIKKQSYSEVKADSTSHSDIPIIDLSEAATSTAVGSCTDYNHPERSSEFTDKSISPDCKRPDGCLFCEHFAIHSDEIDVRKLLSCREVIMSLKPVMDGEERYLREYGPIVSRIDEIVNGINELGNESVKDMISRITVEVGEDGILDPFWERRMDMLIRMGVISL
jgi:hypothetical protein